MELKIKLKNSKSCMGCPCLNYEKAQCWYMGLMIYLGISREEQKFLKESGRGYGVHDYERPQRCIDENGE